MAEHPIHVATYWMGNTTKVALEHYARVTDDDYAQALSGGGAKCGAEHSRTGVHGAAYESSEDSKSAHLQAVAALCESLQGVPMEDRGLELSPNTSGISGQPENSGAKSGALSAVLALNDPKLNELISSWNDLPGDVKKQLMSIISSAHTK